MKQSQSNVWPCNEILTRDYSFFGMRLFSVTFCPWSSSVREYRVSVETWLIGHELVLQLMTPQTPFIYRISFIIFTKAAKTPHAQTDVLGPYVSVGPVSSKQAETSARKKLNLRLIQVELKSADNKNAARFIACTYFVIWYGNHLSLWGASLKLWTLAYPCAWDHKRPCIWA